MAQCHLSATWMASGAPEPSGLGNGEERSRQITSTPGWEVSHLATVDTLRSGSRSTGRLVSMSTRTVA